MPPTLPPALHSPSSKSIFGRSNRNQIDRLWMEDERFDELVSLCDIAGSHLISAREAGFRRDRSLLGDHLLRARNGLRLAIQTFNMLPSDAAGRT